MIVCALFTTVLIQQRSLRALRAEIASLSGQLTALQDNTVQANTSGNQPVDADEAARLRAADGELARLRNEVTRLRNELQALMAKPAAVQPQDARADLPPELKVAPFAEVTTNAIPGRYRCIDMDAHGNVTKSQFIQLNPDGSFLTFWREDGQASASPAYKWLLHPQGLVLTWQRGISLFHRVAAPGIYVSLQPDQTQLRIEKVE